MRHESQASAPVTTQTDDLAVISDALHRLRPYRQTIVLGILAAVVAASLVGFFMYQRSPVEAIGQIRFHLVFDAASRNQYPDGTPFSPADITAHRVLLRVHQDPELQRSAEYDNFKSSIFVIDERATSRGGLSLNMRDEPGGPVWPRTLMEKATIGALAVWARDTEETKSETYTLALASTPSSAFDAILREDFLIAAEALQTHVRRATGTIAKLSRLPGASAVRAGREMRSLTDIHAQLEDVARRQLDPVLDAVRTDGVSRNAEELRAHVNNRLYHVRTDRERSEQLLTAIQESIGASNARLNVRSDDGIRRLPPASGVVSGSEQSFFGRLFRPSNTPAIDPYRRNLIDRIISASEEAAGLKAREAYYHEVLKAVARNGARTPEQLALLETHLSEAAAAVSNAVNHILAIHEELAKRGPSSLYVITSPFSVTSTQRVSARAVTLFWTLAVVLSAVLIPAACLVHATARQKKSASA